MKIGIMGGTFDPIHRAHLAIAEEARQRLKLDVILFMPAGHPWLKEDGQVSPAKHRVEMLRLAIADKPYFKLSTTEIERPGLTYSVETLTELRKQLAEGDEIYLILGSDSLAQLPLWKEPSKLVQMSYLVVAPRPGYSPDLKPLEEAIPGLSKRLILLDKPQMDISATEIRARVSRGLSIKRLVPEAVEKYIKKHRLYIQQKEGKE